MPSNTNTRFASSAIASDEPDADRTPYSTSNGRRRIALTGGPGGGKTTAADLLRREIGEVVVVVPEAATMIFTGGFPRCTDEKSILSVQHAIYHVQRNLEDVQSARFPDRILLCDRGTVDGAAYWPGAPEEFFATLHTTLELELARYDGVIFFESAAVGGIDIEGGNPMRNESIDDAARLDAKLHNLWARHPNFVLVRHHPSFFKKISFGLAELDVLVRDLAAKHTEAEASRLDGSTGSPAARVEVEQCVEGAAAEQSRH